MIIYFCDVKNSILYITFVNCISIGPSKKTKKLETRNLKLILETDTYTKAVLLVSPTITYTIINLQNCRILTTVSQLCHCVYYSESIMMTGLPR